jgi:hypothetical protein
LAEGENPHPTNYQGCSHVKELQKRKSQRAPKTKTGRVFSSNLTTPVVSFMVLLQGSKEQEPRPQICEVAVAGPATVEPKVSGPSLQQDQQTTGQSVQAPNVTSVPLDNMLRVVTVVQQITTEFNGAVTGGQNSGHYYNCLKSYREKWPLEFIDPSKS